jgi:uncharacterized protein YqgV (UPF0045/DUF77 family)
LRACKLKNNKMKISVELTLTPLQDNYEPAIIDFIKALRNSGLTIKENPLSTQVYGDYDEVMHLLDTEIKSAFEAIERGLIYIKIVKSDRSDYAADF